MIKARDYSNVVDVNAIARERQGGSGKEIRDPEGGFICQSVNLELMQLVASRQIQVGSIHTSSGSKSQPVGTETEDSHTVYAGADSYGHTLQLASLIETNLLDDDTNEDTNNLSSRGFRQHGDFYNHNSVTVKCELKQASNQPTESCVVGIPNNV